MSTTTANLGLFKYNTETDGNVAFSINQALNNNWDILDAKWNIGNFRNIGEIITSTIPLVDAGLHLLDGALINGSGIYSEFVTYIAGLVSDYPDLFDTEANWQTSVTTYGVCGKFVYDSVNNTVRLPKYSNKIYTKDITSTAPVKGNGKTLGLTDGTNNLGLQSYYGGFTDYAYHSSNYGKDVGTASVIIPRYKENKSIGVTTDASKSGIIADLSNITTSLEGYYYIVIATSTKTDIQVDIDEIATDLNGKADVDLSNISASQSARNTIVGWATPDFENGIAITSTQVFTPPSNGWIYVELSGGSSGNYTVVYNGEDSSAPILLRLANMYTAGNMFIQKGKKCYIVYANSAGNNTIFYPVKGA